MIKEKICHMYMIQQVEIRKIALTTIYALEVGLYIFNKNFNYCNFLIPSNGSLPFSKNDELEKGGPNLLPQVIINLDLAEASKFVYCWVSSI